MFESKNTKEDSIKEMRELFCNKTEEIMDLLWSLTDSIYETHQETGDIVDEIYNEKNDSNKKFSSQIVNPNTNDKPKHAITSRDDGNRGERSYRGRVNREYDREDYYDNRRPRRDDYRDREGVRTIKIGDKQLVMKNKPRSRSNSKEKRDRSRDNNEQGEQESYEYYPQERYQRGGAGYYAPRRFGQGGRFGRFMNPGRFVDYMR